MEAGESGQVGAGPVVTVTYTVGRWEAVRRIHAGLGGLVTVLGVPIAMVGVGLLLTALGNEGGGAALFIGLSAAIGGALHRVYVVWRLTATWTGGPRQVTVTATRQGITVSDDDSSSAIAWSAFASARRHRGFWLLRSRHGSASIALPVDAFDPDQAAGLEDLLRGAGLLGQDGPAVSETGGAPDGTRDVPAPRSLPAGSGRTVTVTCTMDRREIMRGARAGSLRWRWMLLTGLLGAAGGGLLAAVAPDGSVAESLGAGAVGVGVVLPFFLPVARRYMIRQATRAFAGGPRTMVMTISGDGFTDLGPEGGSTFSWSVMKRVELRRGFWILRQNAPVVHVLPARALSDEQAADLRAILSDAGMLRRSRMPARAGFRQKVREVEPPPVAAELGPHPSSDRFHDASGTT